MRRGTLLGALIAVGALSLAATAYQGQQRGVPRSVSPGTASVEAAEVAPKEQDDTPLVPSRPETVTWGWFPTDRAPVLTIQSGDTVHIDTLSHAGATQGPEEGLRSVTAEPSRRSIPIFYRDPPSARVLRLGRGPRTAS